MFVVEHKLGVVLNNEAVVGSLLLLSAHFCAHLVKSQRALADWAYRAGRKAVDDYGSHGEHVLLSNDELKMITDALPLVCSFVVVVVVIIYI